MPDQSAKQWFDLAVRHQAAGRMEEARSLYRQVLSVEANHLGAIQALAFIAYQSDHPAEAAELLRHALALLPRDVDLLCNLGSVLVAMGDLDGAIVKFREALALKPDAGQVHNNLGNALQATGRMDEAIAAYRQSLALRPDSADALNNLGTALNAMGRRDEAIEQFKQAVASRPQFVQAWNNLATALREKGDLDESFAACERALSLDPNFLPAYHNLGNTHRDAGRAEEAITCYRKAESAHNDPSAEDDLLLAMLLHPSLDARQILDEHVHWNRTYARPLVPAASSFDNDPAPERRLRIGYISPDFSQHPVGRLVFALLANHDHTNFEIFCYNETRRPDAFTEQLRAQADQWRNTAALSDEQLAHRIGEDRIDILMDLTMHTKHNRLLMFARKPAPVQATYLAYPGTTGLETIDYRLTDSHLDPLNADESRYCEQSIRLPRTFWCYSAPAHAPQVNAPPAQQAGRITFGCLNLYSKVTPVMLSLWGRLLAQLPDSRIIIHSFRGSHRERARDIFAAHGVQRERVEFVDRVAPQEYFQRYHQIDIGLDTFPYPGGTTSFDALWMGVPVVTLVGATPLSRGGLSILHNLGLNELVAHTQEQYLHIAKHLATNRPRMAEFRATLRNRLKSSPLMDALGFARDAETAYRRMWRAWCREPSGTSHLERLALNAHRRGDAEEAVHFLRRLIALHPNAAQYHSNLAMVLASLGRLDEAVAALRTAVSIDPANPEIWNNLGNAVQEQGNFDEAAQAYRSALRARPGFPAAMGNLASSLRDLGQLHEAISLYRSALAAEPNREMADNLLLSLHFHPDSTPQLLKDEHARWNQAYARHLYPPASARRPPVVDKPRLRIGYVAVEFHGAPTGRFLLPLLENHNRSTFEIVCYANSSHSDQVTGRFRSLCDLWRLTTQLTDEQLAQLISDDQIDILVDCANHTRGNRLLTFARKPAPVQVTYLPYCSTTGLETIDYRITDPFLEPPDADDRFYSERSVRLPHSYWCYAPATEAPEVQPLPAPKNGYVTFGCFNSYLKVSNLVLAAWCELLRRVPNSRLMITCRPGSHRQGAEELFSSNGIDPDRLTLVDHQSPAQYFRQYHQIDIALDPFPYGGGTTTCDALWMGVPVVSLAGKTAVSRAGLSILSNIGRSELVARDTEHYVQIARSLAADLSRLSGLRATLRHRMQSSPLMDARGFASDLEAAYRAMQQARSDWPPFNVPSQKTS